MILQGITWDHERGILPLLAVSEEYHRIYPDIEIHWKKRSLKDFEDFPIEKLVKDYDLIMVDHPFMSEARKEKLLLPLQELLSAKCMDDLKRENIGQTYDSYWVDSDLMALPVDAATQVSAYRPDYFAEKGLSAPRSFEEIFKLAASLEAGKAIGACMNPTHIFSTYMSLSAQQLGKDYFDRERGIDENVGVFSAECIYRLKNETAPATFDMNPIQCLNAMAGDGEIVYAPYIYGYVNYSLQGYSKHRLKFTDAPLLREDCSASTQVGGVGLAITNRVDGNVLDAAVKFAEYLVSSEVQRTTYTRNDGQPAAMCAWLDEENNEMTLDFFKGTLKTLEKGILRPKVVHWNLFQEAASNQMFRQVQDGVDCREIARSFNRTYQEIVGPTL